MWRAQRQHEIIMNAYEVSFFFKGTKIVSIKSPDIIQNATQAQSIAYGGIKCWFEQQGLPVPEFVRNVHYIGSEEYQWEILPLN